MKPSKLIIFDLDQTIMQLFPFHNRTSEIVMKKVFNVKARMQEIDYAGKMLKNVLIELARLKKIDKKEIDKKIDKALKIYVKTFISSLPRDTKRFCLPGVIDLIKKLAENKENYLIILSGDAEKIIKIVLKRAGLLRYFKLIISGEKSGNRIKLMKYALKLSHKKFKIKKFRVFVIGDSVHDVVAGKSIGAITIAVTTGIHTQEQLKKKGADFIFRNLNNKKILGIIGR